MPRRCETSGRELRRDNKLTNKSLKGVEVRGDATRGAALRRRCNKQIVELSRAAERQTEERVEAMQGGAVRSGVRSVVHNKSLRLDEESGVERRGGATREGALYITNP